MKFFTVSWRVVWGVDTLRESRHAAPPTTLPTWLVGLRVVPKEDSWCWHAMRGHVASQWGVHPIKFPYSLWRSCWTPEAYPTSGSELGLTSRNIPGSKPPCIPLIIIHLNLQRESPNRSHRPTQQRLLACPIRKQRKSYSPIMPANGRPLIFTRRTYLLG